MIGFTLPLGVALEPGIGLTFGTDPVKVYPVPHLQQFGCIATAPFDDKLAASLQGRQGRQ